MFGINIQHDNDKTFNSKGSDFWVKKVYHGTEFWEYKRRVSRNPKRNKRRACGNNSFSDTARLLYSLAAATDVMPHDV